MILEFGPLLPQDSYTAQMQDSSLNEGTPIVGEDSIPVL